MTHLRDIIIKLADADVDFVIAGGVACVLHGVERFTLDLDVSVGLSATNLTRFIDVMEKVGLLPRVPVPSKALLDPEVRQAMVEEKNALVYTFIDLDGRSVRIASISKLLELKESIDPPRDKDQIDIAMLKRLLSGEG